MSLGDRVGVVGSRSFSDYDLLRNTLDEIQIACIISGGAAGADSLAEQYAKERDIKTEIYKPDWNRYGKSAGAIRNADIVRASDHIVAFWDGTSRGTKITINMAKKANKNIVVVTY